MTGPGQKLRDVMIMQFLCEFGLKRCWMNVITIWKQTWKSFSVSLPWGNDNALCWFLNGVWSNSLTGCFYWRSLQPYSFFPNSPAKWVCLKSINFCFLFRFPSSPLCPPVQAKLPMLGRVHSSADVSVLSDASLACLWPMQASVCFFLISSLWKVKVANMVFHGDL